MDAFQPLSLKADSAFVVISDTTNADDETVPGAAQTIDITDYMRGSGELKFGTPTNSQTTAAEVIFEAKLEGSMLTITPKDPQPTTTPYAIETFTIMVSDGGESNPIMVEVKARRNRSPGFDTDAEAAVGTQAPDEAPDAVRMCSTHTGDGANQCYVNVTFTDADQADGEDKLSFTATSSDTSKVEVVSVDNAPTSDTDATPLPLVARLVVKGVASTWDTTLDPDDHTAVEVIVIATDAGGETARGKAQIEVDGAPTLKETIPGGSVSQGTDTNTYVIQDVSGFFEDPEGATLTFTAESGNTNAATVAVSTNQVTVTRNAPGTAVITVTATEPTSSDDPQQTVKGTFTVTVR